jgi:hypothetical protein
MLRLSALAAFLLLIPVVAAAQPAPVDPPVAAPPPPPSQNPDAHQGASVAISEAPPIAAAAPPAAAPPVEVAAYTPPPAPVAAAVVPAPDAPAGLARVRAADATAHRTYLGETALTVPAGTVVLEARAPTYSAGGIGATVGVSDRLQLGATAIWASEDTTAYAVAGKLQLARGATWALAIQGVVLGVSNDVDADTVAAGVVGSLCLDRACRILVTGDVALADGDLWADDFDEAESAVPVIGGASITAGGDSFRLVGEARGTEDDDGESLAFYYGGARLTRPRWSLDAGLGIAAVDQDVYLLPLLGASLRM